MFYNHMTVISYKVQGRFFDICAQNLYILTGRVTMDDEIVIGLLSVKKVQLTPSSGRCQ